MYNHERLLKLTSWTMPFSKYQGRILLELPEEYLLWFERKGFPEGELGILLQMALEIRIHGAEDVLKPLLGQHSRLPLE